MRYFRCIFFVTFFLSFAHTLSSQVPGYLGKRTVIGYGFNFHPALAGFSMGYSDNPFNVKHEIFIEHATRKATMVGANVQFFKYVYNNTEEVDPTSTGSYYYYDQAGRPTGSYEIRANNFMFYNKLFHRTYLAPWGRYFMIGAVYTRYTAEYRSSEMFFQGYNSSGRLATFSNFGAYRQTYQTGDIIMGLGRSRVFGDKIIFDCGYNFQLISVVKMAINFLALGEPIPMSTYIQTTSSRRISATNRFNFYMKLGFLF